MKERTRRLRKTMNTVAEATADLQALGYRLRVKKARGFLQGTILKKPKRGSAVDLMMGPEPTDRHRVDHPELCAWLDKNSIADRSNIVLFTTSRPSAKGD
jgi:hypothetical protein